MEEVSELRQRIVGLESDVKELRPFLGDIRDIVSDYGPEALIAGDDEALLEKVTSLVERVSAIDEAVELQVTPRLAP